MRASQAPAMRVRRTQPDSLERLAPGKGVADPDMHSLERLGCLDGGYRLPAGSLERLGCLAAGGQAAKRLPALRPGGGRAERMGQ
jgi:hypothetical protein